MFKSEIIESSFEMTKREQIKFKDTSSCFPLNEESNGFVIEDILGCYTLRCENDKAENPSYDVFIIVCNDGRRFMTSSSSFSEKTNEIITDLIGDGERVDIRLIKKKSKNFAGEFLTCELV